MKSIYLRAGTGKSASADMFQAQLEALGHNVVRDSKSSSEVIVCWGTSIRDYSGPVKPTLNGSVNLFDKFESMKRFQKANVNTPTILKIEDAIHGGGLIYPLPWFARSFHHKKGNDIVLCKVKEDVDYIVRNQAADFFSVYVPHDMELRAWVFGGKMFAVYHKIYKNPGLNNFKNLESRSELRDDLLGNRTLIENSTAAVSALKIDFGAVDILRRLNGRYYTLEVNSMPDISSMIRVNGIRLAKLVSNWVENR
jgi:hypothetical protein